MVAVVEESPRLKWFTMTLVRLYFKLFHQHEVLGQEHLPPTPPLFVITNHVSLLDVPAFALADRYVGSRLVAKESLLKIPVVKQVLQAWGAIPVARDGRDSSALRGVLTALREGRLVALASEGTRNPHGELGETNPVLARLAIQASSSGIPLIPLAAVGTYECLPRGAWFPRPGKIKTLIGPQFDLSYLKSRPKDEGVQEAQRIIRERIWVMMESGLPIAPPVARLRLPATKASAATATALANNGQTQAPASAGQSSSLAPSADA